MSKADYEGSHPGYEDVTLTDPVPVWLYAVPQPIEEDSRPGETADWSVQVTEQELAVYLEDTQIGQQALTDYGDDADTDASESREPTWSLEREVSLSLAPEDNATGRLVNEIFRRVLSEWVCESDLNEVAHEYQESARAAERHCYLDEWFSGGDRDSFTIELLVTPTGEPVNLSVETRRIGEALTVPIEPGFHEVFTELVLTLCTEIAFVSERIPPGSGGRISGRTK
ncbi:hypothetical protein ACFQH8_06090 [Halomicroarcula sp. GCM10025710]